MNDKPYAKPPASIESIFVAATVGWIIVCPEENVQLGDIFLTSEEAFRLSKLHNQTTGHNSIIQPFYDLNPLTTPVSAQNIPLVASPIDVTTIPWPFCILYDNIPKQPWTIYSPDPDSAAVTMAQLIALANRSAVASGYPPLWRATAGNC